MPRCIRLFEKPVSWANASGICRENYGDLVTFMDDILKLSVWGLLLLLIVAVMVLLLVIAVLSSHACIIFVW